MNLNINDLPAIRTLDRQALAAVRGGNSVQAISQAMPVAASGGGGPSSAQSGNSVTQQASNVSYQSNFTPLGIGIPGLYPMLGGPFGLFPG